MPSIDLIADYLSAPLILFVLVTTRLGVMMMAMPGVGEGVPMKVRVLLVISISLLIVPLVSLPTDLKIDNLVQMVVATFREAGIGLMMGAVVRFLVTGMQMAGELASNGGGLQLGESIDPELRANVSTISRLVGLLVATAMITMGGHRMMIEALLDSFRAMPPGDVRFEVGMLELLVFELGAGISAGIHAGAPIIVALLLSNLVTGLISRTLPQLNILAVGLPVNAMTLMVVAAFTLGGTAYIFQQAMLDGFMRLKELW
jgi:flagellar biosynthetic protein FliR